MLLVPAPTTKMFGKEKRAKLNVIEVDLKNFPAVYELPQAPSISKDTLDLVKGRLQRHRDEFLRVHNENQRQRLIPSSLRTEEVEAVATALSGIIPVTSEYMRLNETFKNLEQISQNMQGHQLVYWMGVTATFDGSRGSRVLVSSVKEGTKNFSWAGLDLRSNVSLSVEKCFPLFFHKHPSVEENRPLQFFVSHHWKPKDERIVSSGEDIASTLASAELPLENICFGDKSCTIRKRLPLVVGGRRLRGVNGRENPYVEVTMSISLEEE